MFLLNSLGMNSKKKCRQYSAEYLKFGFIASPQNVLFPHCLLCNKTFNSNEAMKPSRMKDHLSRAHTDKMNKELSYFQHLKTQVDKQPTLSELFTKRSTDLEKGLLASYEVSLLIAKCGKPHTIGETLILPAIKKINEIMLGEGPGNKISQSVPLSNNTVSRRIDEMATDVEFKLTNVLKKRKFALQIDESTVTDNKAILLAYVRFINEQKEITEEMLFARTLITDTKGSSIFKVVKDYFDEKDIPLTNVSACATDGAPAMTGHHAGFLAHFKKAVPDVITIHCVIHRQHLAAKKLSGVLHETLQLVITSVNKIKANSLNDRLFRQLCHENDEQFERLLLHTAVRWLSKGNCLRRFFELFDTVTEFLDSRDPVLSVNMKQRKLELAYLTDIFEKMNEVNISLQGNKMNLIKAKGIISSFIAKFDIYKANIGRKELINFPALKRFSVSDNKTPELTQDKILVFTDHLEQLKTDMLSRFEDLTKLQIPDWIFDPFSFEAVDKLDSSLQTEFLDLKYDCEAKIIFKQSGYELAWVKLMDIYPQLWGKTEPLLISFPSTYLVEKGFSSVVQLLTKQRNKLDICLKGDLRLNLTNIKPDIQALAEIHQAQGAH